MGVSTGRFGTINGCRRNAPKCKYKCCSFKTNYIVLYPGELEATKLDKSHLTVIDDDYFGGKKAVCVGNKKHCRHGDFKPLDCKSYPLFPMINENGKVGILRGMKCPLTPRDLKRHRADFLRVWEELAKDKKISDWLRCVNLVGYAKEK